MDVDVAKNALENGIAFVQRSGLRVLDLRRGHVHCLMPLKGNVNHVGTMYAGALFTLAEIPGGALFLASFDATRWYPIVKEHQIRFLKPATGDVTVTVDLPEERIAEIAAAAEAQGKAEFVLEVELKDAAGVVVATGRGVYQLRAIRR